MIRRAAIGINILACASVLYASVTAAQTKSDVAPPTNITANSSIPLSLLFLKGTPYNVDAAPSEVLIDANANSAIESIRTQAQVSLAESVEYGAPIFMMVCPGKYSLGVGAITHGSTNSVLVEESSPTSSRSVQNNCIDKPVGKFHTHPGSSVPSPIDMFNAYYSGKSNLVAGDDGIFLIVPTGETARLRAAQFEKGAANREAYLKVANREAITDLWKSQIGDFSSMCQAMGVDKKSGFFNWVYGSAKTLSSKYAIALYRGENKSLKRVNAGEDTASAASRLPEYPVTLEHVLLLSRVVELLQKSKEINESSLARPSLIEDNINRINPDARLGASQIDLAYALIGAGAFGAEMFGDAFQRPNDPQYKVVVIADNRSTNPVLCSKQILVFIDNHKNRTAFRVGIGTKPIRVPN